MVLVTHTGAKSGVVRTTPLVCSIDGDDVVLIASMGGAPNNPAWYHNMVTNPTVTVEVGTDSYKATVVETTATSASACGTPTPRSCRSSTTTRRRPPAPSPCCGWCAPDHAACSSPCSWAASPPATG